MALNGRFIGELWCHSMDTQSDPDMINEYLGMIEDSNGCIQMYKGVVEDMGKVIKQLRQELKEKEEKLILFMQTDPFSISRNDLRTFFIVVKERHETDAEWALFQSTFQFKLQREIYNWIDSLEQ